MTTTVYRDRMLNAARAVRESRNPAKFTMLHYGQSEMVEVTERQRHLLLFTKTVTRVQELNTCGTPQCVLGHYAFRRDLQRTFNLKKGSLFTGASLLEYYNQPVLAHFGITKDEAGELFGKFGCAAAETPAQAADYIEAFAARKWPEAVPAVSVLEPGFVKLRTALTVVA